MKYLIVALITIAACNCHAQSIYTYCYIERIVDGDTAIVVLLNKQYSGKTGAIRCRLAHIDAPESDQKCGDWSAEMLRKKCEKQYTFAFLDKPGAYGRAIADIDKVNLWMVRVGAAHPYHDAPKQYMRAARKAIKKRRGIWAQSLVIHPKDWRDGNKKGHNRDYYLRLYS